MAQITLFFSPILSLFVFFVSLGFLFKINSYVIFHLCLLLNLLYERRSFLAEVSEAAVNRLKRK
jgi:hypothetical protein